MLTGTHTHFGRSGLYETANPTPAAGSLERPHKSGATAYASCFRVGDWFQWNYPETS